MSEAELAAGKIPCENVALFMCDMQEKFRPAMVHFEPVASNAKKLVDALRILNIPLVVTEQYPKGLGSTIKEINIEHAAKVVPKTKFSMVVPEIEETIKSICNSQLKCVIIFGIEAHVCLEQTAIDLVSKGLKVHVVADASTSRTQEDRLLAFERLRQIGCFICTTENVIFKIVGDKDHPKFSEIRPLMKDTILETGLLSKMYVSTRENMSMNEKLDYIHAEINKLSEQGFLKSCLTALLRELRQLKKRNLQEDLSISGNNTFNQPSTSSDLGCNKGITSLKETTEKKCSICSKVFTRHQDLKRHLIIHNQSASFLCEDCGKSYRSADGLSYHRALYHDQSADSLENLKCPECFKVFPNDTLFKVHLKNSHQRAKSLYTCSDCNPPVTFQRKDVFKNHIALHSDEKKFECQLCCKNFSSRSNLKAHWRTHDPSASIQCSSCLKKFNSKRKCSQHVIECQNKKACNYCKFNCNSFEEMINHMKRVHPADYAMQAVFGSSLEELG